MCELYRARATRTPGATLFQTFRDEAWQPVGAAAFMAQAEALAAALRALGLTPGLRLAILAVNGLDGGDTALLTLSEYSNPTPAASR